ncbi:MAG: leucine-rich repeat domain-containing protein, partial [Clostridia bacterium]|nr:leucine-rich repeat domain-containing protein [Clostridia bacterium]
YYTNTGGAEFIVINKMIYKYVGPNKAGIDLSDPSNYYRPENTQGMLGPDRVRFNAALARVETIEAGAFENCSALESIILPRQITHVSDYAFANLKKLATFTLHKDSKLVDIGSHAFDNSLILSKQSSLYNDTYKAILIGGVYFRHLDTNATSAVIPDKNGEFTVTHIASRAFVGCDSVESISFENQGQIVSIGSDAFVETKYITLEPEENKDAYTSFNGILTAFYGPERDTAYTNLIVPDRVSVIATNAFGQYARYFNTVQIKANVTEIQSYAFSGASMLQSIIFPEVQVDENDGYRIINAPAIGDNAFANSKGEMPDRLLIFFSKAVMDKIEALSNDLANVSDEITRGWINLYLLHKSHFIAEDISLVEIDPNKISKTLL